VNRAQQRSVLRRMNDGRHVVKKIDFIIIGDNFLFLMNSLKGRSFLNTILTSCEFGATIMKIVLIAFFLSLPLYANSSANDFSSLDTDCELAGFCLLS
jgi:hypothetical protein